MSVSNIDMADDRSAGSQLGLGRLGPKAKAGLAIMGLGIALVLITWLQIRDIQNTAAQIPYITSGGLLGLGLMVVGGIGLFSDERAGKGDNEIAALSARLEEMAATSNWTADVVEQIAGYLNQQSNGNGHAEPAATGSRRRAAAVR